MKAKIGDWVRFYSAGQFNIGVVEYVQYKTALQTEEYLTDNGCVSEDAVLEVRETKPTDGKGMGDDL